MRSAIATAVGLFALTVSATSEAAEFKLIAANALRGALVELTARFEQSSGHKVATAWGGTTAIAKRIESGEAFDIVVIGSEEIDALTAKGLLAAGSRVDFAKSGSGVAIKAGLPKPDVSNSEALKNAVLAAKSVAYSSGPSGYYIAELFKKMGISERIKDKVKQPASGVQVSELLARGEAEIGFQQISELIHATGIDYLGPLPAEIQNITIYSAGLHTTANSDAARPLIEFLSSPAAHSALKKIGMEPGSR